MEKHHFQDIMFAKVFYFCGVKNKETYEIQFREADGTLLLSADDTLAEEDGHKPEGVLRPAYQYLLSAV